MGFSWQLPGYSRGNIPPGSSLVLERWRDTHSGERFCGSISRRRVWMGFVSCNRLMINIRYYVRSGISMTAESPMSACSALINPR